MSISFGEASLRTCPQIRMIQLTESLAVGDLVWVCLGKHAIEPANWNMDQTSHTTDIRPPADMLRATTGAPGEVRMDRVWIGAERGV